MEFRCPNCHWRLRVPDDYTGPQAVCGNCQQLIDLDGTEGIADYDAPAPSGISHPFSADLTPPGAANVSAPLDHRGGLLLALAICGWLFMPLLSPVVWIMGRDDLRLIRSGRMDAAGQSITSAATILAMINCLLWLTILMAVALVLLMGMVFFGLR